MGRKWIDEELRQTEEREAAIRDSFDRRRTRTTLVKEQGPGLMRQLVDEIAAAVDEYRIKASLHAEAIRFQELPHEGFSVTKASIPSGFLECRPDYSAHTVYCNRTQSDGHDAEPHEFVFDLHFVVNAAGLLALRHEDTDFADVASVAEFLLRPVMFPRVTG